MKPKTKYATLYSLSPVLRERVQPSTLSVDTPDKVSEFWRTVVTTDPRFNGNVEQVVCMWLNTRMNVIGWTIVSVGIVDQCLVHARELFAGAIVAGASAVVMSHNHPSGDITPSDADVRVSREMHQAGKILRIPILDSVIVETTSFRNTSMKSLGYLA